MKFFSSFFPAELANIMNTLYGGVCYAGIDTDPELKYPKGAGRVAFSNQQSYIAAISARFVQLQHGDIDKRVWFFHFTLISFVKHLELKNKFHCFLILIEYSRISGVRLFEG